MKFTIKTLKSNGLVYDGNIDSTPILNPAKRGEEILTYLKYKQNKNNFVIIDDEMFDFETFYDKSQIIKTEIFHSALSKSDVEKFLDKDNILIK